MYLFVGGLKWILRHPILIYILIFDVTPNRQKYYMFNLILLLREGVKKNHYSLNHYK